MKTYNCNGIIEVGGVKFADVEEIISYARSGESKGGVYVGEDSKSYPCFDSSDYLYENRRFWNLIFATSKEKLKEKLAILENVEPLGGGYFKLTKELHPMAYWQGESRYNVQVTELSDDGRYIPPDYKIPVVHRDDVYGLNSVFLDGIEKEALMENSHYLIEEMKEALKDVPEKGRISSPYRIIVDNDSAVFIVKCKFILEVCTYEDFQGGEELELLDYCMLKTSAVDSTTGLFSTTTLCIASSNEGICKFLNRFFADYDICESLWKNYISIHTDMLMIME